MAETNEKSESKAPLTPEQKAAQQARRKAARVVAFTQWRETWQAAHPDATPEERKAAWAESRDEATKNARKFLRALEKKGLRIVSAEPVEA